MKVYKNGICREIDPKREQEFKEKGYIVEGKETSDVLEVLKQQNEALKMKNEALKAEIEKHLFYIAKTQIGGDENAPTDGTGENGENAPTDGTGENGETTEAKTTTRARK